VLRASELAAASGPAPSWGHMIGALALGEAAAGPVRPAEEAELRDLASRFFWALDEQRAGVLSHCLAAEAVLEGSVAAGERIGPLHGRERIVTHLSAAWSGSQRQRRHFLANTLVERPAPTEAEVLAYFLLISARGSTTAFESAGFCRLRCVRRAGGWELARAFLGFDAIGGDDL